MVQRARVRERKGERGRFGARRPMGRAPCCDRTKGLKKGPWTPEEDKLLVDYIQANGHGSWRLLPKLAGQDIPDQSVQQPLLLLLQFFAVAV